MTNFEADVQRSGARPDLRRLNDVPVELSVEIGRTKMTVGETLELRPGSIVTLNRLADEPVELLVNGTPIAHGEVVVVDEDFALRITRVLNESETSGTPSDAPAAGFDEQDITPAVGEPVLIDAGPAELMEPALPEPEPQAAEPTPSEAL